MNYDTRLLPNDDPFDSFAEKAVYEYSEEEILAELKEHELTGDYDKDINKGLRAMFDRLHG